MVRRKFAVIDHPSSDPSGNSMLLSSSLSMYEVTTVKTLKQEGGQEESSASQSIPQIFCASRNNWFVMIIGSDLHIFDTLVGFNEFNPNNSRGRLDQSRGAKDRRMLTIPENEQVLGITFLPTCDVFVILLGNGSLIFSSPVYGFFYEKESLLPSLESCSMSVTTTYDQKSSLCILSAQTLYLVTVPEFDINFRTEDKFGNLFSTVELAHKVKVDENLQFVAYTSDSFVSEESNIQFVAYTSDSFVYFPRKKGEFVLTSPIFPQNFDHVSKLFRLREDVCMVRTIGVFIVVLMTDGRLAFYDQNLILNHVMTLFANEDDTTTGQLEAILDFEFLDVAPLAQITEDVKLLLKIKTSSGVQYMIKQLNEVEEQFCANCSEHTVLVPFATPGDDFNIVYVDAFPAYNLDSVFVRFVSESQPSLKLNRLLDFKRFDQALAFAKNYNLSLDLVYIALVRHYQEQIQLAPDGDYEESLFQGMMDNLKLLSDQNSSADMCCAALTCVTKYEHIKIILTFVNGLSITDDYTLDQIAHYRYELASYRMIFGPTSARFDRKSEWIPFLSTSSHDEHFDMFCAEGKIAQAKILYSRYMDIQRSLAKHGAACKLLSKFKLTITDNPALCLPLCEFMESDLVALFLGSQRDVMGICGVLCEFFIDVSMLLEIIQPNDYPQNALNFAQTFDRAIELMRNECRTSDQHVSFVRILKQLAEGSTLDESPTKKLSILIKNLRNLMKIYSNYQCPMSYSEYLTHDVNSICHRILDRLRTTHSVREHIEHFVFPYIEEHRLDRNQTLHGYIKQLASANQSGNVAAYKHGSTWDLLCLQVCEQITDSNVRCKAIIEIASGAVPPWSQQLSNVVKAVFAQGEKIDPELIKLLRRQCYLADLGQIFISNGIRLNVRHRVTNKAGLQSLLQNIFKNSGKEMSVKLQDSIKIVNIYESLMSRRMFSNIDCYYVAATMLMRLFPDEHEIKPLMELFQLIKTQEEVESLAWKIVTYLKCQLRPTTCSKLISQRPIWLSCLLCVLVRYLPHGDIKVQLLIQQTRDIRKLQLEHQILVDFNTFRDKGKCMKMLTNYIEAPCENTKTIVDIVGFGTKLGISMRDCCSALIRIQIKNYCPASMDTLEYLILNEHSPTKTHLEIAHETCKIICYYFTDSNVNDKFKFNSRIDSSRQIIGIIQKILPKLIDWSIELQLTSFADSFFKISRYIMLFSLILQQCPTTTEEQGTVDSVSDEAVNSNEQQKGSAKLFTMKPRQGILLPHQEGTMYDPMTVIRAIKMVASSVVDPPDGLDNLDEFYSLMCESWKRLFIALSNTHMLLEIFARQFANTLPCFRAGVSVQQKAGTIVASEALNGIDRLIVELCKKIFVVPIADLQLAAHLLANLPSKTIVKTLLELNSWIKAKKNVRYLLNFFRVSLFLMMLINEKANDIKHVAIGLETTNWQKRLLKHGVNLGNVQLKRENVFDLAPEFSKVQLSSAFLKEYCNEVRADTPTILLNYAMELCKYSSVFETDSERFTICIETAKSALEEANEDEKTRMVLVRTLQELCPYNYEAIGLVLNVLQRLMFRGVITNEDPEYERLKDRITLMNFLKLTPREKNITSAEIRWFKNFVNPRHFDMTLIHSDTAGELTSFQLSESTVIGPDQQQKQAQQRFENLSHDAILPQFAQKRLPFHLFLLEDKESIEKYQKQFLYNELTIYNVQHWITLVEEAKTIVQHSRTNLLVGAIHAHVNETVKYNRKLGENDLSQISELTYESHNRLSILKGLATRFQRLLLGETKISLIEMCCQVVEKWIANFADLKIGEKECESYEASSVTLRQSLAVLNTEFLLENHGLLDTDTSLLTQKPADLINHLCSAKIDWADSECIDKYFRIIDEISKIHCVKLEEIYNELLTRWIPGNPDQSSVNEVGQMASDPDSTVDFMTSPSSHTMANADDMDFVVPVLYYDPQITRIIMLLKRINDPFERIAEMSKRSYQDVAILHGGYMTKIRIVTCIFRFLNDAEMQEMFNTTVDQFCCLIINLLNQRLYSLCRIEVPMKELNEPGKALEFVRSILSPKSIYRQTPEIAHLIVCLIVDNGIDDIGLLGKAAERLLQLRLFNSLRELLKHIRGIHSKDIKNIPDLPTYFGRTFEDLFEKLADNPEARCQILLLVHFLLGCPIEGQGQFKRAVALLTSHDNSAAGLVAIAANAIEL